MEIGADVTGTAHFLMATLAMSFGSEFRTPTSFPILECAVSTGDDSGGAKVEGGYIYN